MDIILLLKISCQEEKPEDQKFTDTTDWFKKNAYVLKIS